MAKPDRTTARRLLAGRTDAPAGQAVRYVTSGGLSTAVDFLLLKLCTDFLGIFYLVSSIIGYAAGLAVTYTLSIRWVFSRRKVNNRLKEFLIFTMIGAVGIGLTFVFMWVFTDLAGIYYIVSKIITTILVAGWNFAAKKIILF